MLGALGKQSSEKPCDSIDTLIGADVELRGNIAFSGGLRIDGKVKGNITAQGAENSTLILGDGAVVHGNVIVPHVISNGQIKGNVRSAECIELQPHAEIAGDVHYKIIGIARGAVIKGNLVCESESEKAKAVVTKLKPVQ